MGIKVLQEVSKKDLEDFIYHIDTKDPNLYKELANPNKIGLFQINGETAEKLCNEVKPENFDELIAINAMARPGPMETAAPFFVLRKQGSPSPYPQAVNELIKDTHYTFIYQEQIMEIFHKIGGFTLEEANEVRNLMKKLGKADKDPEDLKKWDKIVRRFINGATKNEIPESLAKSIANDLSAFSGYSFNKCFAGSSKIDRDNKARWSPTIEEMFLCKNNKIWAIENKHKNLYKKYNFSGYGKAFSLNEDGRLYLNDIIDITFAGKRIIFEIILENGKKILVTKNHKFPTQRGELSIYSGLCVGDYLYSNDGYDSKQDHRKYNFTDYKQNNRIFKTYEGEKFKEGEENSGYINGESIKFEKFKKILLEEAKGVCQKCKIKKDKLECHHIDGNRKNNEKENLIVICSSCHKILEYELGRRIKNFKGKLTTLKRIIEINEKTEENTYNVEMLPLHHTLAVDGIIASNSHATSYSYIAAITVYLSYYFRLYFYSSVLTYEVDREKYLLDRLYAVKNQGIEILPVDINESDLHFKPIGEKQIRFGLADIKFVSESSAKIITEKRPYYSLYDFIMKTRTRSITSRVIESLISIGAFDKFNKERKKLLLVFKSFWDKKGTSKIEEKLKELYDKTEESINYLPGLETYENDLVNYEKEFIGFRFFSSPFTPEKIEIFKSLRKKYLIYFSLPEIGRISKKIPICINFIKDYKDKNNNLMAFLDIEDVRGNKISIPMFHSYYRFLKDDIKENNLYLMNLYMSDTGKILFGRDQWMDKEFEIKKLVKKI